MKISHLLIAGSILAATALSPVGPANAFPEAGKRITMIVGSGAGGSSDLFYRLLAKGLEKEAGRSIEIINKAGAGTQFELQEVSTSKGDGYTLGQSSLPTAIMVYLDPQKQAQFNGGSFIPISMATSDPGATAVHADSPYKTMKDLIDAAKANPGKIKFGSGARNTRQHFDVLDLEKAAGVTFQKVHADSAANPVTMLVGGHLDVVQESVGDFLNLVESGQLRILGVWDNSRSPMAPNTPTMAEQGYKLNSGASRGIVLPAGSPKEAVEFWDKAIKKVTESAEFKEGMAKLKQPVRYMDQSSYDKHWKETEARLKPLLAK